MKATTAPDRPSFLRRAHLRRAAVLPAVFFMAIAAWPRAAGAQGVTKAEIREAILGLRPETPAMDTNGDGKVDVADLLFQVRFGVNDPPVLILIGDRTVELGATLLINLMALEPEGDPVGFMVFPLPLPPNASLNGVTGQFRFTPEPSQVGLSFAVTFIAEDGQGGMDAETLTITAAGPPPGSATAVSGRILDTNDFVLGRTTPIVGVTVTLIGAASSTVTTTRGTSC